MNSFMGMLIGFLIVGFMGIVRSSRELQELERRPSMKNKAPGNILSYQALTKDEQQEKGSKTIYASRSPINSFRKVGIVIMSFVAIMVAIAFSMEGFDDLGFLVAAGAVTFLILSPLLGISAYYASLARDAKSSKRAYLEFNNEGMICHSRLCGPVQEILWDDITEFTPIFPALSVGCLIQIEHRIRDENQIAHSRYLVNVVAIELAQFVSLLEFYTGLETKLPDSNLYH